VIDGQHLGLRIYLLTLYLATGVHSTSILSGIRQYSVTANVNKSLLSRQRRTMRILVGAIGDPTRKNDQLLGDRLDTPPSFLRFFTQITNAKNIVCCATATGIQGSEVRDQWLVVRNQMFGKK
jgi:hypothetical protein